MFSVVGTFLFTVPIPYQLPPKYTRNHIESLLNGVFNAIYALQITPEPAGLGPGGNYVLNGIKRVLDRPTHYLQQRYTC